VTATVPWELATEIWEADSLRAVENRDELQVHFRTRMAGSTGAADSTVVQVLFTPSLTTERGIRSFPGRLSMVDSLQVLAIAELEGQSLDKVERYRFDPDAGSTGQWVFVEDVTPPTVQDPVEILWDPQVEDPVDARIAATLTSDFGFDEVAIVDLDYPLPLGEPTIEILGGNFTTSRDIQVVVTCSDAGYVVLSEQPDFAGATWVAWADTLDYELEDVFGTRFLYAAYNNPLLAETKVASTLISLVSPPARERR
jgi:hypothetical protein